MRKIIVFENVSLDGMMSGPNGDIDWAMRDDELTDLTRGNQPATGLFVFGRVTYDMMAAFWPTPAAMDASPTFARILNASAKLVFSRTMKRAAWQNTAVASDLTGDMVTSLKQQPGDSIMIFGSASIVDQLSVLGLVDEYQLVVNPVVLGSGRPLFGPGAGGTRLALLDSRTFKSGLVFLRYRPIPG